MQVAEKTIALLRLLSLDAIDRAGSGHPGAALGMAPCMYGLWADELRFHPGDPWWYGRDRFVLSGGHASALLYATLHLADVREEDGAPAIGIEDLKSLRRLGSKTPGHPEYGRSSGIECSTGPLGQGIGASVGMAAGLRWVNKMAGIPDFVPAPGQVFAFCGEGDLMEGIGSEAAALAGHWGLGNLTWMLDSNKITIEGGLALACSEDLAAKFNALGWSVAEIDGRDPQALSAACRASRASKKPTLIIAHTTIGEGAPTLAGTHGIHAGRLKPDELAGARANLSGGAGHVPFQTDAGLIKAFSDRLRQRSEEGRSAWQEGLRLLREKDPDKAGLLDRIMARAYALRDGLGKEVGLPPIEGAPSRDDQSTRHASGEILQEIARRVPELIGGSADLGPSTCSRIIGAPSLGRDEVAGRNIHFGAREAAMGCVANGLALVGLRPYDATLLSFVDHMLPSVRMGALMGLPVIHILTLDSIAVGGDGSTHQPIEQLSQLRLMPGLRVIRPADARETRAAWNLAMERPQGPTALILSRQALPRLSDTDGTGARLKLGMYVLKDNFEASKELPELILLGAGSEVSLLLKAQEALGREGVRIRVVSAPCTEAFDAQPASYRDKVLPLQARARLAVEMGRPELWRRYVGLDGDVMGITQFGRAGIGAEVIVDFGFTEEKVVARAKNLLAEGPSRPLSCMGD